MQLDAALIARELDRINASLGRPLHVVAETGSTNDDARRAALSGARHGATFLADTQTSGRGRGGRRWHSPPGENLYLSVVLRPNLSARCVAPIALVVGIAVANVVERRIAASSSGPVDVRLKWPNDVLASGRKVAGILVEGQLRGDRVSSLVVGVGLNVHTREFPPELASRATSLVALGCDGSSREVLAAELLKELGEMTARFEAGQLAPFAEELARVDWLRGQRIRIGELVGVASGIDAQGHLLVCEAGGELRSVAAGEVSVIPG